MYFNDDESDLLIKLHFESPWSVKLKKFSIFASHWSLVHESAHS